MKTVNDVVKTMSGVGRNFTAQKKKGQREKGREKESKKE